MSVKFKLIYPKWPKLQELLNYAWNRFYGEESQAINMSKLYEQVIRKEKADGTFHPRERNLIRQAFGINLR